MTTQKVVDENVTSLHVVDKGATPPDPFANLDALRIAQDFGAFMDGEIVGPLEVRTLKEDLHLRVNPDPEYSLYGHFTVTTKNGTYFIQPQFRGALGALPRKCNLHIACDGHGVYFLLLIKQSNPTDTQQDNLWYRSARETAAAAAKGWVKVTKPSGGGWGHIPLDGYGLNEPIWPTRTFGELLNAAFPDRVVTSLNHDLIVNFQKFGA
jgi:hypothetical protein